MLYFRYVYRYQQLAAGEGDMRVDDILPRYVSLISSGKYH